MVTPLYTPKEIRASANEHGEPIGVTIKGRQKRVTCLRNTWRLDDEWWRSEISRRYFELELEKGAVVTVFHDLLTGRWYQQQG